MIKTLKIFFLTLIILNLGAVVQAGKRFTSSYPCSEAVKTCVSSGTKIVDGFAVTKDCWEWSYIKTCNYPSKDDCKNFYHCYAVANHACLLKDSLGNCVNLHREFCCKSWDPITIENKTIRQDLVAKDGQKGLICKGMPCIDGHCVDKSYMTNGEMMDSISKLYAVSSMNPDKLGNFNLFQGYCDHCSKKATSYTNCCAIDPKGWGKNLGAKCTKDENDLMDKRSKKLCVYVGKVNKQTMGVTTVVKHHYCCFGSILDKVLQVEGRKQLGMNFGSGGSPNCRGFTLEEIQRIDWDKVDFTEFIEDFKVKFFGKYKSPNPDEISERVNSSMASLRKYDNNPNNQENNMTGWKGDMQDESWEADEERRIEAEKILALQEAERLEQERLAKIEAERLEQIRLAKLAEEARLEKRFYVDGFLSFVRPDGNNPHQKAAADLPGYERFKKELKEKKGEAYMIQAWSQSQEEWRLEQTIYAWKYWKKDPTTIKKYEDEPENLKSQ
jgi:hypothetical protein